MEEFDPDAYLAQTAPQSTSFDPDAYLAQTQTAPAPKVTARDRILSRFRDSDLGRKLGDTMGGIAGGANILFKPEVVNATAGFRRGLMQAPVALGEGVGYVTDKLGLSSGEMAEASRMRDADYAAQRQEQGKEGFDYGQLAGEVASPLTWAAGTQLAGAKILKTASPYIQAFGKSALAGLGVSQLTPTGGKEGGDFIGAKTTQGVVGTVFGGALGVAGQKLLGGSKKINPSMVAEIKSQKLSDFRAVQNNVNVMLQKEGIDISSLNAAARDQIDDYVAKAVAGGVSPDDAAAVARQAMLENLPVPIKSASKGQLTQGFEQQQLERMAADTATGAKLRVNFEQQPKQLAENLEFVKKATGGKVENQQEFGRGFKDFILGEYKKAKGATSAAYQKAERETGNLPAQLSDNEITWLVQNQGFPGVSALTTKAKALGILGSDDAGNLVPKQTTFKNIAQLRSTASGMTKGGGQEAHYGGEFKKQLDGLFEDYGSDLYKQAAQKRREQGITYESGSKIISDLIKKKGGSETDDLLFDEKVLNRIAVSSSADDINKLYSFLDKTPKGKEQIKNIRAAATLELQDAARGGEKNQDFALGAIESKIKQMGGYNKLKAIYGEKDAKVLMNIVQSGQTLMRTKSFASPNSATASKMLMLADNLGAFFDKWTLGMGGAIGKQAKAGFIAQGAVNPDLGRKITKTPINALSQKQGAALNAARNALVRDYGNE